MKRHGLGRDRASRSFEYVIPLACHTYVQVRKPGGFIMRNCMSLVKFLFLSLKQKALNFFDKTEARLRIRRQAIDVICFFM
jgi:hypothetical protein